MPSEMMNRQMAERGPMDPSRMVRKGDRIDNRRKHHRWFLNMKIRWRIGDHEQIGTLMNVGTKGAFIQADASLPTDAVEVFLLLPFQPSSKEASGTKLVGCKSRVAHREEGGFGIEFLQPNCEFFVTLLETIAAAHIAA